MNTLRVAQTKLSIGPRPGKKSIDTLRTLGFTHCCTLLSAREGAEQVRKFCKKMSSEEQTCDWVWLPIEGGNIAVLQATDMKSLMGKLLDVLKSHPSPHVYIHCSAGIHRTGFVAYLLLRMLGSDPQNARVGLESLRAVTYDQVGEDRLEVAEHFLKSWG